MKHRQGLKHCGPALSARGLARGPVHRPGRPVLPLRHGAGGNPLGRRRRRIRDCSCSAMSIGPGRKRSSRLSRSPAGANCGPGPATWSGPGRSVCLSMCIRAADLRHLGLTDLQAVTDVSSDLLALRRRKSPWEIGRLEETGRVAAAVYRHAAEILRPGMTEAEFAGLLFAHAMQLGHEGLHRSRGAFEAYSWHVLSGPNTARPGAVDTPMSGEGLSPAFPWGRRTPGDPTRGTGDRRLRDQRASATRPTRPAPSASGRRPTGSWRSTLGSSKSTTPSWRLCGRGRLPARCSPGGRRRPRSLGLTGYLGRPGHRCRFVGHGVGLEIVEPP